MLKQNRKIIFGVVCSIFMIITPLIILISLGYNFNSGRLKNSLQVKIETYPISAKVFLNNRIHSANTPTDIAITQSGQSKVNISKEGYLDETLWVNSRVGQNLNTNLTQLKLLQSSGRVISTANQDQESITIVDNNLIWVENKAGIQKLYIQKFNANQLNGQPIQVQAINQLPIIQKVNFKFEAVGEEVFFDRENQIIIFLSKDIWKAINLDSSLSIDTLAINQITKKAYQVVSLLQDIILIRDTKNNLWELNLTEPKNYKIKLLDQDISYLYYNIKSKNCWFLNQDKLYRIDGTSFSNQNNVLYLQTSKLLFTGSDKLEYLTVSNFIQGVIIQVNNQLYYHNDSSKNNLSVISSDFKNVINHTIFEDTLFWISQLAESEVSLQSWNFNTNYQSRLGKFKPKNKEKMTYNDFFLDYASKWSRVVIFEKDIVFSLWYNKSSINHNIVDYSLVPWINDQCYPKVVEQNVFCLFRGLADKSKIQLQVYENNNLF